MAEAKAKPKVKARVVKNPESFRQRAIKASQEKPKNQKLNSLFKPIKKLFFLSAQLMKRIHSQYQKSILGKKLKKPLHIISTILFLSYLKNSFIELKMVTWPTWKQSRKLTFAVLAFAVVFGAAIAGVDWLLGKIFKDILLGK
jgi:preprotein translocase subunit SecE